MTNRTRDRDTYGNRYRSARKRAFKRSNGTCRACGCDVAEEGHHWAVEYPEVAQLSHNDLTALCTDCRRIITAMRRARRSGLCPSRIASACERWGERRIRIFECLGFARAKLLQFLGRETPDHEVRESAV